MRRHSKAVRLWPDILAYHERGVPNDRIAHIVGVHAHTLDAVLARFVTDRASTIVVDAQDGGFEGDTSNDRAAELRRAIVDLRRQGLSGRAIAGELKVGIRQVYKVIGAAKRWEPRLALQRGRASETEIARILALRQQRKSVAVISRETGVPAQTVRRVIGSLTQDQPDLALTKGISTAQLAEFRALLGRSVPLTEIAERFGQSPRSIERALARAARAKRDGR